MGFTVPNATNVDTGNKYYILDQAEPDSVDFDLLSMTSHTGVFSGCQVTYASGTTVNVSAGSIVLNGQYYTVNSVAGSTLPAAPIGTNRFDLVIARVSGGTASIAFLTGPESTDNPIFPPNRNELANPAGYSSVYHWDPAAEVILAAVYRENTTAITTSRIVDKRVFIGSYINQHSTAAATGGSIGSIYYKHDTAAGSAATTSGVSVKNSAGVWVDLAQVGTTSANSVLGRGSSSGIPTELTASTNGHVLRRNAGVLGFGQTTTDSIGDGTITDAKIVSVDAAKVIGEVPTSGDVLVTNVIGPGTLDVTLVPSLDASKITTGTFSTARIPALDPSTHLSSVVPISKGGTGSSTASGARTNLDAQQANAKLTSFSGLTGAADTLPYFTGTSSMATATLSSFARTLIDDTSSSQARTTLGLGTSNSPTFAGVTVSGTANVGALSSSGAVTGSTLSTTSTATIGGNAIVNGTYVLLKGYQTPNANCAVVFENTAGEGFTEIASLGGTDVIDLNIRGDNIFQWSNAGGTTKAAVSYATIYPVTTNTVDLGSSAQRWRTIYSNNALNTSDENLKNLLGTAPGLSFFRKVGFTSKWKWKDNPEEGTHMGPTAQAVLSALSEDSHQGTVDGVDSEHGLMVRFNDLWGPTINAMLEMDEEIQSLKDELAELRS